MIKLTKKMRYYYLTKKDSFEPITEEIIMLFSRKVDAEKRVKWFKEVWNEECEIRECEMKIK